MVHWFANIDALIIEWLQRWGIAVLRIMLGVVFLWFGILKLYGASAVTDIVATTYNFLPNETFMGILGILGIATGVGLLFKIWLRFTLFLLWFQMLGTLVAPILKPELFFRFGNIFFLTLDGEFVLKNLVLLASGLAIGGSLMKPLKHKKNN